MIHTLIADLNKGTLTAFLKTLKISCKVRNELSNRRKDEVILSIPDKKPVQPRPFPKGTFNVSRPLPRTDPYLAPFFIPTDAQDILPIWELDEKGNYKKASDKTTVVKGYGLHASTSSTTLGCIKVHEEIEWLVEAINRALDSGDFVRLKVI